MTSILVLALLLGVTGFLDSQKSVTAEGELRTIGNRLAGELAHVDDLGRQGGAVNLTTDHPSFVAGSTYDAGLEHGAPCSSVPEDTCLVLTTTEFEFEETIPLHNETNITLASRGGGRFEVHSFGARASNTAEFTAVDMSSRIGVGRGVQKDSYETLGSPGNKPPIAFFDFKPGTPQSNSPIRFDANGSFDRDGTVQEYRWDWDDDGTTDEATTSSRVVHTLTAGTHNVTLEVTDDGSSVTNFTREIDVSGLRYLGDMDTVPESDQGVFVTVENEFSRPVTIQKVVIDPHDDGIDELDEETGRREVEVDVGHDGTVDSFLEDGDGFDVYDGGRILEFGEDGSATSSKATVQPGEIARISMRYFGTPMSTERLDVGVRYLHNGTPNATLITDTVGGPEITNYRLHPSGRDVDLSFTSSEPLSTIDVDLGGDASGSLSQGDFTETGSGPYQYEADVSDGTIGTFWANMTTAEALGAPSDDTPLNDTAIVSGNLAWRSTTDWDDAVDVDGIVHASYGDHRADELSLGYPATDSGLVGYWPLDDTAVTPDASGTGNDGTPEGSPSTANGIGVSDSYHLDPATNDHVRVSNDPSLELGDTDRVTVSAWVSKDSAQGGWRSVLQHSDESFNLQFRNGDIPRFTIYDGSDWTSAEAPSVAPDTWHHFVGTYDGSTVRLYRDGSQVASKSVSDMAETSAPLGIGENLDASDRHVDGKIDEVRVYDRALSSGEVLDLYLAGLEGHLETNTKVNASGAVDVSNLQLQYDVAKSGSQMIEVKVHSDEGEESPWMSVPDGTGSVSVPGLSTDTDSFHLEVRMSSTTVTQSPVVEQLALEEN
jgi:hypothetical protein